MRTRLLAFLFDKLDCQPAPASQYGVDREAIASRGGQQRGVKSQMAKLQAGDRPVLLETSAGEEQQVRRYQKDVAQALGP